jgi:ribose-phosphate pyrophosphokinase
MHEENHAVDPCRVFAGNASRELAAAICRNLQVPLGDVDVGRFEDGEVSVRFNENIRGGDVFIVQTTGSPAENLMELLIMLDAAKRASARRVCAVVPYFGYARQDRKDQPRAPISAKLVANLITGGRGSRATMDLHSAQIRFIRYRSTICTQRRCSSTTSPRSRSRTWWSSRPTSAA